MARMRSVKPEFWTDEDLADLRRDARLLYLGLWNIADEHARLRGDPRYVKGQIFPYDDDLPPEAIGGLLSELASAGKVLRYKVAGRSYLFLPNLAKHQRLEAEKVPSRLPGPDESEPDPDEPVPRTDEPAEEPDRSDRSGSPPAATDRTDESARDADELSLKHVAGSREQVAGSRRQGAEEDTSSELAPRDSDPPTGRPEIERICTHLAERIQANGSKRPAIGKKWRDAARLMLDNDGRTEQQIHAAIDWCQQDEFWRRNILSMPKLRDQYDRLRLQAESQHRRAGPRPSTTDDRVAQAQALKGPGQASSLAEIFERTGHRHPNTIPGELA